VKGFTHVSANAAQSAIDGFEQKLADGRALRDEGIRRYYNKNYTLATANKRFSYTRWKYKAETPMSFCRKHSPDGAFFGTWADILHTVLTDDEQELIHWWSYIDKDKAYGLKCLLNTSEDGKIIVDDQTATFINKYGAVK
jgi:hypothetical protein